jgi:cytochrome c oxidase assembly protein subunit 11
MDRENPPATRKVRRAGLTAAACAIFVAGMVGMAFAAVPLYKIFCQLTGYGGTTQQAERAPSATLARELTIRFDANISNSLGWSFRPEKHAISVKVGEVAQVDFIAENRSGTANTGVAAFNVAPGEVGAYFNKISCFCFTAQTLAAGEARKLPVVFFVDPAIAKDHELDSVDTVTLSYSFYPAAEPAPAKPLAAVSTETAKPL